MIGRAALNIFLFATVVFFFWSCLTYTVLCPPFFKQHSFCFEKKEQALRHALTSHSAELKRSHKYYGIDREEMKSQRWLSGGLAAHRKLWVPHVLLQLG